jgi:hypothetical protein
MGHGRYIVEEAEKYGIEVWCLDIRDRGLT